MQEDIVGVWESVGWVAVEERRAVGGHQGGRVVVDFAL
jgi:hypothetical protein